MPLWHNEDYKRNKWIDGEKLGIKSDYHLIRDKTHFLGANMLMNN